MPTFDSVAHAADGDPIFDTCEFANCTAPATVVLVARFYEPIASCDTHVMSLLHECEPEFVAHVELLFNK